MRGFTLLEVMIATAIASTISVVLFVALRQTMGYQERVDTLVDTYTRATLIQNQLERDFMGFFVPNEAYELVSSKTGTQSGGKEKAEQIDRVFYGTKGKEQFGVLSFITTNAMQVYWGKTMGAPKPLVARVVYRLNKIKDSSVRPEALDGQNKNQDSYVLTRQESRNLDFAPFEGAPEKQKVRAYEIVDGVKSMKVTYLARVYTAEEKKGSSASPRTEGGAESVRPERAKEERTDSKTLPTWTYKEFSEWDWSPKSYSAKASKDREGKGKKPDTKKEPEKKEQISRVPMYIKLNLELWNPEHTSSTPFEFVFVRKPFEMMELEKDTPPESDKPAPQMPSLKPMLDMLKPFAGAQAGAQPQQQALPKIAAGAHHKPGMPGMPRMPNSLVAQAPSTGSQASHKATPGMAGQANQGAR